MSEIGSNNADLTEPFELKSKAETKNFKACFKSLDDNDGLVDVNGDTENEKSCDDYAGAISESMTSISKHRQHIVSIRADSVASAGT